MNNHPRNPTSIADSVTQALTTYFATLGDEQPTDVHKMVLSQVEKPLIEFMLQKTADNKSQTAAMLGITRNTLRTKIKQYQISQNT